MKRANTMKLYCSLPLTGRLVSAREIATRIGKSVPTIYRWEQMGIFPKRVRLVSRSVAWRGEEVQQWIDQRYAGES